MQCIITTANELLSNGQSGGSTGETIAAALVLNEPAYLPYGYANIVDAWERLGHWQGYIPLIQRHYMHLINLPR
jgi:hypothetical protein